MNIEFVKLSEESDICLKKTTLYNNGYLKITSFRLRS